MRIVGFVIHLAMAAGLIAAGGGILALGVKTSYTTYIMFQALADHADTIAMGQPEGAPMSGAALAMAAGLTPWLIIGGELLVGLVLLFYGLRGLLRRLVEGLPPPAEAAETPEGRLGHALFYAACTAFGGLLLVSSLIKNADHLIPKLMGETASAKVIAARTTQDRMRYHHVLAYQFQTADGAVLRYETEVPASFLRKLEAGMEVAVRYMPGNPAQHMFPGAVSYTEYIVRLVIYIFVIGAGIAGVQRNLNYVEPE